MIIRLGCAWLRLGAATRAHGSETLDLPDPTWLQFRRRLDKLEPFCRIVGHTSEEVREILATLETVYRELFPQLNPAIGGQAPSTPGSRSRSSIRPTLAV